MGNNDIKKAMVVGGGSIGNRHLRNLLFKGQIQCALLTRSTKKEIPPGVTRLTTMAEAIEWNPDIVFICTPTALHAESTIPLLEKSRGIYLEKPVSHTLEDALKIQAALKKTNGKLMVGYQYRFHPTLVELKRLLAQGKLGKLSEVKCVVGEYLPLFHPEEDYRLSYASQERLGGGVVLTLSHEIDYLLWLFGAPLGVNANGGKFSSLEIDVEDTANLSWTAKDNVKVDLHMNYLQNPPMRTLEIYGEKGKIEWNYYDSLRIFDTAGLEISKISLPARWDRNDLFLSALDAFTNYIQTKMPSPISMEEGLDVMRVAAAALKSIRRNIPSRSN